MLWDFLTLFLSSFCLRASVIVLFYSSLGAEISRLEYWLRIGFVMGDGVTLHSNSSLYYLVFNKLYVVAFHQVFWSVENVCWCVYLQ